MIFKHLSLSDLQKEIGEDLLRRLAEILPGILQDDYDPTILQKKDTLIKILLSFSPSNRFKNIEFRRKILNSLPPNVLLNISQATNVGIECDTFDERVNSILKKGWSNSKFCSAFISTAGLQDAFMPLNEEKLSSEEEILAPETPFKRLKDFQSTVFKKAYDKLDINLARILIQMPTGSGKTRTSMEVICDFLNNSKGDNIVFWLANSEELCEQSIQCFKEVWVHIGLDNVNVYRVWGNNQTLPIDYHGKTFVVGGFQKMYNLLKKNKEISQTFLDRIILLVIDEAHMVLAPTYKEVAESLIGKSTNVLGLTATPGRSSQKPLENQQLADFFFSEITGITPPEGEDVFSYLRAKKILSKVRMDPLITNIRYNLTPKQISQLSKNYDFSPAFLSSMAIDDIRNLEIIKKIMAERNDNKSILFFACNVAHSKYICAMLVFLGIKAAHVDGSTPKQERREIIKQFKIKDINVLCNYGVLTTGFDAPQTDVVFISRPTNSIVLYSQMIGRGLRGPVIGGTEYCKVINVVDNIIGMPKEDIIYDYFERYWTEE